MENLEKNKNVTPEDSGASRRMKIERGKGIRKGVLIAGIFGVFALLISFVVARDLFKKEQGEQLALRESQKAFYNKLLNERDSTINDWLMTVDEIEKDFNLIKQKENLITVKSGNAEFSKGRKEQILEDVKLINTLLDNNKKKIADLSARLNKSGGTIKGLQSRIASLEVTLKQYESDISGLKQALADKNFEIDQLNSRVTEMNVAIAQKDDTINNQINTLNKAFLAQGTYRELKAKGIVTREGGFLGIGKTGEISKNVSDSLFSKVDIRDLKNIDVNAREVKLITKHPSNSYRMIKESDNKIARIEITDPENFWKLSRYAVVELVK